MLNYWFTYDENTSVIYPSLQEDQPIVQNMGLLGPYPQDTATSIIVMAYNYPERFLAQGNPVTLVEQPYFTISAKESTSVANQWIITGTLNNPSSTSPANATFTIAGKTETSVLTNGQATITVNVHSSITNTPISITVGATGCATSRPVNIGGQTLANVQIQTFTPSGGFPTVAPTGVGSKSFLSAYYALSPASIESILADIGTAVSLLTDVVFNILLPSSTATLNANQQNAFTDIKANILPSLFTTLANAYPSGGTKQLQYADYVADLAKSFKAYQQYMADLQNIPNLA